MSHPRQSPDPSAAPRNWTGWIALAIFFGFMIPGVIVASFSGTDAKSKDPVVQAGNLEAIVGDETPKNKQTSALEGVIRAMAPKRTSDEDAAAVYAAAVTELHKPLSVEDLRLLTASKVAARRAVAQLYANPPPDAVTARVLAASLPRDLFLSKLARAQTLERLGDTSERRKLSPELYPGKVDPKLGAVLTLYSLGMLAGTAALIAYLLGVGSGSIKWQGHPLEPEDSVQADRLAVRAAQLLGISLIVEIVIAVFAEQIMKSHTPAGALVVELVSSISVIACTVVLTMFPVSGRLIPLSQYGLTKRNILPSLYWGVAGFLAVIPLATVGLVLGSMVERFAPRPDHPLTHLLEDPHNVPIVLGAFFLACVQAPFTEELLFRGTLIPALSGLFRGPQSSVALAIGVSSLLFAALHPQGFTLWLPLASVGAVNGVLCYQTRSVLPGMVMHALFNATAICYTLFMR